jgi:hypothetical protein
LAIARVFSRVYLWLIPKHFLGCADADAQEFEDALSQMILEASGWSQKLQHGSKKIGKKHFI